MAPTTDFSGSSGYSDESHRSLGMVAGLSQDAWASSFLTDGDLNQVDWADSNLDWDNVDWSFLDRFLTPTTPSSFTSADPMPMNVESYGPAHPSFPHCPAVHTSPSPKLEMASSAEKPVSTRKRKNNIDGLDPTNVLQTTRERKCFVSKSKTLSIVRGLPVDAGPRRIFCKRDVPHDMPPGCVEDLCGVPHLPKFCTAANLGAKIFGRPAKFADFGSDLELFWKDLWYSTPLQASLEVFR
ncbi:hypothetical protein R3P38DRAFT_2803761 [Favolaschia claudopus]